jgi:hypothetical protein
VVFTLVTSGAFGIQLEELAFRHSELALVSNSLSRIRDCAG